eukprot:15580006-Heterocapsa_arctica.AAC.1
MLEAARIQKQEERTSPNHWKVRKLRLDALRLLLRHRTHAALATQPCPSTQDVAQTTPLTHGHVQRLYGRGTRRGVSQH